MGYASISFRCDLSLKRVVEQFTSTNNIKLSDFCRDAVMERLSNIDIIKDGTDMKKIKRILLMKEKKAELIRRQEQRYFLRNFYRGLFRLCSSYKLNSGKINYNVTCKYINEAIGLFETFDDDIKEEMIGDMQLVSELKKPERLNAKFDSYAYYLMGNKPQLLTDNKGAKDE